MKSICPYCGCACRLDYAVKNGKVIKVVPDPEDEVSEGRPCVKGLTVHEVLYKGRILKPLIRKNKKSSFKEVSWNEAYGFIYQKTKNLTPEEILFVPSGKSTNADSYVMQKFARIAFKTNNIDGCCSRLCHLATVKALMNTFGNGAIASKMNDIYSRDCLFIIGSNPAISYPVLFNRVLKSKQKGMKIISIQSFSNDTSKYADLSVETAPGSEVVLLNGIINHLIEKKAYDKSVEKIEGFPELVRTAKEYSKKIVCDLCKIKGKQFDESVEFISKSKSFGAIHGMGLTQHVNAIENVHSLLNLVILKKGKLLSNRGEVNVQGVGDMGCSPDSLPSGPLVTVENLEKIWGVKLSDEKGKNIIESFLISPVKAAFISLFNPAQSLPDLNKVHKNLKRMFLVCLEPYHNLTSEFADVILPTPTLPERNGTITNGERRVRLVSRVIKPLGESKQDWVIFKELSERFRFKKYFDYKDEKEILREIIKVVPAYSKINPEKIFNGEDGWADKEIKFCRFNPEEFEGIDEITSEKYPFILTTFRSQYRFLSDEMTSKSKTLKKLAEGDFCHLNKKDATKLKLKNGSKVKIESHVGNIVTRVKIDGNMTEGVVGMHFHSSKVLVNKLFPTHFDEETFTPNYKIVAVNLKKI
jgi:formate dehydrogenase major subunit